MPRIINPDEYEQKRGEILDAAQRLIYTKGYERMSIQDILDELKISKGAFYHYFDSKQSLLEALTARMMTEVEKFLIPIVQNPEHTALEKLEQFFGSVARWKSARRAYLNNLLSVWYHDHNAIVRQKLTAAGGKWMAPFLMEIIQQGVREGTLHPGIELNEEIAQVVIALMVSMGEKIAMSMVRIPPGASSEQRQATLREMENLVIAYRSAIERVLGAPAGSISLFDLDILRDWVLEPDPAPANPTSIP